MSLHADDERQLRELITATQKRQEREAREAARQGKVTGGVWGFVNYGYRVLFERNGKKEYAWLHVASGAAWIEGGRLVGNVVFTKSESAKLQRILTRYGRASDR